MEAQGIDMSAQWFWIDIFCLDQQHPDKMETIKRSNEIYALAKYYFVIGLACFNRLWCTMELACKLGGQNGANTDVVVTDFEGFLGRRETAYMFAQLTKERFGNFDSILLDESQDLTECQVELFVVNQTQADIYIVGDAVQSDHVRRYVALGAGAAEVVGAGQKNRSVDWARRRPIGPLLQQVAQTLHLQ